MIHYADKLNVTLFQLGLTCFYLFLTQLSYDNRDACIGVIHLNRYRPELVSMIGMFVNILPCRIVNMDLDKLSFIELLYKVQQTFLESVEHAHLPYDELINLYRKPTSHLQLPYLQTIFSVDTTIIDYTNMDDIMIGDSCHLSTYKMKDKDIEIGYKFDLDVSFAYDKLASTIDCVWGYMFDVFQRETIEQHANHFNQLLTQLFASNHKEQLQIPLNEIITWNKDKINNHNQVIRKLFT
jgi:non-ribosomal peptide synthetase component F